MFRARNWKRFLNLGVCEQPPALNATVSFLDLHGVVRCGAVKSFRITYDKSFTSAWVIFERHRLCPVDRTAKPSWRWLAVPIEALHRSHA